jgi:hypothetical protein
MYEMRMYEGKKNNPKKNCIFLKKREKVCNHDNNPKRKVKEDRKH